MHSIRSGLLGLVLFGASAAALALPLSYTEITIYDGDSAAPSGWYGMQEDQETEPGTVTDQSWDLESFFRYGSNQVGMISGYNFFNTNGGDYRPGDIFVDTDGSFIAGNAQIGSNGNTNVANSFGYEYVFDIDWSNNTYNLLQITSSSIVTTTYYGINYGSSPWQYVSGGTLINSGSFTGESGLSDAQTGKLGSSHYAAYGFDMSFLGNAGYTVHFTSACGNDNLMGEVLPSQTVVPLPGAVWLFGGALGTLWSLRRRARS